MHVISIKKKTKQNKQTKIKKKKSNEKAWKRVLYNTTKLGQPSPNIAAFIHRDATSENFMNYMHSKTNKPKQAKSKHCAARLFS